MDSPDQHIPRKCFGRGKHVGPQQQPPSRPSLRPSRPGEAQLRHDGVSLEVKRWFQQLRRLQSLKHALGSSRSSPHTRAYQLDLWTAIVQSRGFAGGFRSWWERRPTKLLGSPHWLPDVVPTHAEAVQLYDDFHCNFRQLESWHLRHSQKVLDARYDRSLAQMYRDLRGDRPEQVSTITLHKEYAILAVSGESVHLESPIDDRGSSTWSISGAPVQLVSHDSVVCTFSSPDNLFAGQELEQAQTLSSTQHLHYEFGQLWASRWQQNPDLTASSWQRFLDFALAFLPSGSFDLAPITTSVWHSALRRFKPRAARGPDGWALQDLRSMPPSRVEQLLTFLALVESQHGTWPQQLVTGFVCLLNKHNGRTDTEAYRPICLYSIVYRTWSGIRARQLLRCLRHYLPEDQLGFVPGMSATSLWYAVQCEIELCCQGQIPLMGYSTDIQKCFNNLPRLPLLALAAHVGVPWTVLRPWTNFLQRTERRIIVQGCVGHAIHSDRGFPEGCPLSPLAMVLAGWAFHSYMSAFCPQVQTLSYADNWSGTANTSGGLATGIQTAHAFADSLGLTLDPGKTFVWALHGQDRAVLKHLGHPVAQSARELGGFMAFGTFTRNAELKDRCAALAPIWSALRRSRAPLVLKMMALSGKCWPKALHGIEGCPLPEAEINKLRAAATKALQIRPGGVSSMLRLSINEKCESDPGFYVVWSCVRQVRHIAGAQPGFLSKWRLFMQSFDGTLYQGPVSRLIRVLSQVGWSIQVPPFVCDHEGLVHDLLRIPGSLLHRLLEHAWLQYVATQHRHRRSMRDLLGIDPALLRSDASRLSALDAARLGSLRAGAFISGEQQAKFDLTQNGMCLTCQAPDTVRHQVCECPRYAQQRDGHAHVLQQWEQLPVALTHHLLPPANPHLPRLRALLAGLVDCTGRFHCSGSQSVWHHLFTDGSCDHSLHADFALAAWAVISATDELPISCGPVHGLLQTAPRAELLAMISAARWALKFRRRCIVWADALGIVEGVADIRNWARRPNDNDDLWDILEALLQQLQPDDFLVRHVPSHLCITRTESPFEDWIATHNQHADTLAGLANQNRPWSLQQCRQQALDYHLHMLQVQRSLRAVFFGIAAAKLSEVCVPDSEAADQADAELEPSVPRTLFLEDVVPVNWKERIEATEGRIPRDFLVFVCQFLLSQDDQSCEVHHISWLELVFMLHVDGRVAYPVAHSQGKWMSASTVAFLPLPPTVAGRLYLVRRAVKEILAIFGASSLLVSNLNRVVLGVDFPLDGLTLGADVGILQAARSLLSQFCSGRRVNSLAALARPV